LSPWGINGVEQKTRTFPKNEKKMKKGELRDPGRILAHKLRIEKSGTLQKSGEVDEKVFNLSEKGQTGNKGGKTLIKTYFVDSAGP